MQTVMWLCLVLSTWSLIVSINPMHSSIMIICISDKWQHRLQAALNYIRCVRGYSPPHLCSIAKNCRKVFRFCAKRSSKKTLARSVKKNFRLHLRLPRYLKNKFKKTTVNNQRHYSALQPIQFLKRPMCCAFTGLSFILSLPPKKASWA